MVLIILLVFFYIFEKFKKQKFVINKNLIEDCKKTIDNNFEQINIDSKLKKWINKTIELIDKGIVRIADKTDKGWFVNEWLKKAIILYFRSQKMKKIEFGPFEYFDKIPIKNDYENKQVRVVPHAIARYGSYINKNVILMPSYVNIGAYVDSGSMIDTWATIGSCAQIGKNVHISGGVGIGGVLEPIQSSPVIIEDNCFIGSRCIVVEGVRVMEEAVLGAGIVLTNSTKIIDISGDKEIQHKAQIPKRSVVIPGTYKKKFKCGEYSIPCALIIGKRKKSTNKKTSLNQALRDFNISV